MKYFYALMLCVFLASCKTSTDPNDDNPNKDKAWSGDWYLRNGTAVLEHLQIRATATRWIYGPLDTVIQHSTFMEFTDSSIHVQFKDQKNNAALSLKLDHVFGQTVFIGFDSNLAVHTTKNVSYYR